MWFLMIACFLFHRRLLTGYIDDILITGIDSQAIYSLLLGLINKAFCLKDLVLLRYILGVVRSLDVEIRARLSSATTVPSLIIYPLKFKSGPLRRKPNDILVLNTKRRV